jgi:serine/threonine-protein kinase
MIAKPNRHYKHDTLRQLLDESLPRDQAEQVETHLSQCASCRNELEQIAGEAPWWEETVEILSQRTVTGPNTIASIRSLDASLDWIRPLLDDSSGDGFGSIDKYQIQGVIGQGGMGVVLRGIDPELNRPVAIKVLSPHLAGVGAARARFMREAQSAASVVHPSIVPIYSVVTSARLPYLVMPCINGGNLQQRIDREGPLDLAEILRIGLQVAEGLAAAHRHGVIHRDIKPANILIEEGNNRALISDFGLARALDDATLTISGMIAGTPQYMSPEQARGEPIDARSDLFSLGSLLYALSTGRPPFRAETPLVVLRKITDTKPRPISQINERTPAWFDNLVARLMQKDLGSRIASADEVSCLLRDAHAHVLNPTSNAVPKSLLQRRFRGRIFAAALAIPLLATGGVALNHFGAAADEQAKLSVKESGRSIGSLGDTSIAEASQVKILDSSWHDPSAEQQLLAIQMTLNELATALEAETYPYLPLYHPQPSTWLETGENNDLQK